MQYVINDKLCKLITYVISIITVRNNNNEKNTIKKGSSLSVWRPVDDPRITAEIIIGHIRHYVNSKRHFVFISIFSSAVRRFLFMKGGNYVHCPPLPVRTKYRHIQRLHYRERQMRQLLLERLSNAEIPVGNIKIKKED